MQTRLLRYREVEDITGLSRVAIARYVREGKFPTPVDVGQNRVAFVESEVQAWIDDRIAARETPAARKARAERSKRMTSVVNQRWAAAA